MLALVIASLLWGTTGTAATFFPDDVSPLAIGACTMGVGGILLFLTSVRPSLGVLRDRAARRWVALGAIGVLVYPLAFYAGMDLAGVAVGNVVALGSGPIFAALLEWAWERHPLSARWAVATGLALVGIVLLALGGHPDASDVEGGSSGTIAGVGLGLARRVRLRGVHLCLVPGDRDHRTGLRVEGSWARCSASELCCFCRCC